MSERGPLGIRVPLSVALSRVLSALVAAASAAVAVVMCSSDVFSTADPGTRVVAAAAVLVLSVGVVGCVVLAVVGPWRAGIAAVLVFALTGVAGAVAYGVDVVGGPLLPAALTAVVFATLAYHLLATHGLRADRR